MIANRPPFLGDVREAEEVNISVWPCRGVQRAVRVVAYGREVRIHLFLLPATTILPSCCSATALAVSALRGVMAVFACPSRPEGAIRRAVGVQPHRRELRHASVAVPAYFQTAPMRQSLCTASPSLTFLLSTTSTPAVPRSASGSPPESRRTTAVCCSPPFRLGFVCGYRESASAPLEYPATFLPKFAPMRTRSNSLEATFAEREVGISLGLSPGKPS